jgi:hypothetical protein
MALAGALCQTLLAATGFTNKDLRVLMTGLPAGSPYTLSKRLGSFAGSLFALVRGRFLKQTEPELYHLARGRGHLLSSAGDRPDCKACDD